MYSYLKMVKERYPDVVPFETGQAKDGHGIDQLFSAFKEENYSFTRLYAAPKGNRMTSIYEDPAFRESAIFVARLMRERSSCERGNDPDRGSNQREVDRR